MISGFVWFVDLLDVEGNILSFLLFSLITCVWNWKPLINILIYEKVKKNCPWYAMYFCFVGEDFNAVILFYFYLDIKKDMPFSIGKILSIAILLILKHSKFGIMWVTIMSIDWTRTSLKLMASWRRWIFTVCHLKENVVCVNAVKI